jgi:hypothetical protein
LDPAQPRLVCRFSRPLGTPCTIPSLPRPIQWRLRPRSHPSTCQRRQAHTGMLLSAQRAAKAARLSTTAVRSAAVSRCTRQCRRFRCRSLAGTWCVHICCTLQVLEALNRAVDWRAYLLHASSARGPKPCPSIGVHCGCMPQRRTCAHAHAAPAVPCAVLYGVARPLTRRLLRGVR